MPVRGAARVVKPPEVADVFYPLHKWPTWARRLWFNGFGPGMGKERFSFWKFLWFNGLSPSLASQWVLLGYWGDDFHGAEVETRNWERYAASEPLKKHYLLKGRYQDLESGLTIDLATERIIHTRRGYEIARKQYWWE